MIFSFFSTKGWYEVLYFQFLNKAAKKLASFTLKSWTVWVFNSTLTGQFISYSFFGEEKPNN